MATPATEPERDALPDLAVEVRGLTKVYEGPGLSAPKTALDTVDLAVPRGSLFALLGPNGAGKSTLINILAGLVRRTAGTVRIWDFDLDADPRSAAGAIGVVPQELNIDPFFTPRELLDLQAGMYGVPKPERRGSEILARLGLADKAESYARTLSGGMRRRLLVAKAMVHHPPVLVLDEPTAGVDIELRQGLWDYVRELNRAGVTIVLTTHYLEEAQDVCDQIAIINHGKVIACDTKDALLRRLDHKVLHLTLSNPITDLPDDLRGWDVTQPAPNHLMVTYQPSRTDVGAILQAVNRTGAQVVDLSTEEGDLEDLFLLLTRAPDGADGS